MSSDIHTLSLRAPLVLPGTADRITVRPLGPADRDVVAQLYLDSYPPGVGAVDLASALDEITATFTGQYGELRIEASLLAHIDNTPAGAIFTASRSIWDRDLEGPFIIDLFVDPSHRGAGAGRALVIGAIKECAANQDRTLSLRVGEGTSPQAHSLYAGLGFLPLGGSPSTQPLAGTQHH